MVITINGHKIQIDWIHAAYVIVVLIFFAYNYLNLSYNTAFVDEAIYATVGEEVLRGIFWEKALSWMGGSYLYPLTSAVINRSMGLAGVRLFSAVCVLCIGLLSAKIAKNLGGKKTEVIALVLFLFSSITLDLAQMGTYDAMSFLFISLSFYLGYLSGKTKSFPKTYFLSLLSAGLFSLGVLTKYFVVIFILPIALVTFSEKFRFDLKKAAVWILVIGTILGFYFLRYKDEILTYLLGPYSNQPSTFVEILKQIISSLNIFVIGLIVTIFTVRKKIPPGKIKLISVLFIAGLLPLAYHLTFENSRSLWKHLVFSLFFWAPLTAYAVARFFKYINDKQKNTVVLSNVSQLIFTVIILVVILSTWFSFSGHWRFQRSWPSASNVLNYLKTHRTKYDKVLAEGSAIYKYHLFDGFENPSSWSSTWYVQYNGQEGTAAMKSAITDRSFDFIILNNYYTPDIDKELLPYIKTYYKLALKDSFKVSGAYDEITTVWQPK